MLWANRGVVQAGRDGVSGGDLTVGVLEHVGIGTVQGARATFDRMVTIGAKARRVAPGLDPLAAGLHADKPHLGIIEECAKQADGIRATAHAGDAGVW